MSSAHRGLAPCPLQYRLASQTVCSLPSSLLSKHPSIQPSRSTNSGVRSNVRPSVLEPQPAYAWRAAGAGSPPVPGNRQRVQAVPPETLAGLKALPNWDIKCAVGVAGFAYVWVKIFDGLASAGVLDQKLSRKLVHITSGPLFLLTWPLFSDLPTARYVAALIPSLNMVRLLAVGSGLVPDRGLVMSVSRSGDSTELLKGPLYYVLVLISVTIFFWRHHPAGLVAVSLMCGGDGLADIVGRKFGSVKLPWNRSKSWAGSAAMFLAGVGMAAGFFWVFGRLGYLQCFSPQVVLPYLAAVCGACTVVESLPINSWFDDNLSVPLVAIGMSMLVLPMAMGATAGSGMQHNGLLQMLHLA